MTLEQLPARPLRESDVGSTAPGTSVREEVRNVVAPPRGYHLSAPDRTDPALRDREDGKAVDRLLRSARTGNGGSMVVRGEQGSGKTALLRYADDQAAGMRSAHVTGIESETPFGFAGVHQLLAPFVSRLNFLPAPQRDALRAVAGLTDGPAPDQLLVGLAMLTLLVEASRDQPLLVVIDDAHWLDGMSARLLAFVARRVQARPIAFVIALGEPAPADTPFAELPTRHLAVQPGRTAAVRGAEPAPAPTAGPARGQSPHPLSPSPQAVLLDGMTARWEGYTATVATRRAAVDALLAGPDVSEARGSDLYAAAETTAQDLLDDGARYALAARWVQAERARDNAGRLPEALSSLARAEAISGALVAAEAHLAEARELGAADAAVAQAGTIGLGELTLLAWRGRDEQAQAVAARLLRSSPGMDPGLVAATTLSALTVMELASSRYHAALDSALGVYRNDLPGPGTHILPDVVEAASRSGDRAMATAALDRLAERAVGTGTPLALGLLARCQALLAEEGTADRLYRDATEHLARTSAVPQLARAHLLHGEWLRRRRRRRDARQQLRAAAELFSEMGMEAFARRARVELNATGERVGKRANGPGDELTPQESQIAELVAEGLANRAIAAQLFISPNTVQYHLQKVFRKLAVSSRTQLARAVITTSGQTYGR